MQKDVYIFMIKVESSKKMTFYPVSGPVCPKLGTLVYRYRESNATPGDWLGIVCMYYWPFSDHSLSVGVVHYYREAECRENGHVLTMVVTEHTTAEGVGGGGSWPSYQLCSLCGTSTWFWSTGRMGIELLWYLMMLAWLVGFFFTLWYKYLSLEHWSGGDRVALLPDDVSVTCGCLFTLWYKYLSQRDLPVVCSDQFAGSYKLQDVQSFPELRGLPSPCLIKPGVFGGHVREMAKATLLLDMIPVYRMST